MKLADLQKKLKPAKLDGYLVTRNNMFLNQDVRNDENLLRLLTGFTGSDGSLLILRDKAILFVDGRYELQAPRETDSREVEVFCTKDCSFHRWLAQNTQDLTRFRLGINPWCLTQTEKEALSVNCISVSAVPDFLPPMLSADAANVFEHKLEFAGESAAEKIGRLCNALLREKADAAFFSLADDVSWLFNLRSDALPETPILRAMALIEKNGKAWLFGNNLNTGNLKLDYPLLALSEIPAVLRRFKKKKIMLDHRIGGADDIGFLESVRADGVHADLAGDDDHRNGIHVRVGDRGDHVRRARTGSDDAHAHLSGGQRVAFCRMSGGLLVTHQHEAELRIVLDGIVDGQNRTARNAEDVLDAQILQRTNQRFGAGHLFAVDNGLLFSGSGCLWHAAECLQRRR